MAQAGPAAVIRAIEQLIDFLTAFGDGANTRVAPLRKFASQIKAEGPSSKSLIELNRFKDEVHTQVREQIWAGRTVPGADQDRTMQEFEQAFASVFNACYPQDPQPQDTNIGGFSGSEHVAHKGVLCRGDPAGAREVVERSIEFAQRYSRTLGSGDMAAAYALTDAGLKKAMSFDEFMNEHQQAERKYGGPALEFRIERFAYILTDAPAREQSYTKEGWYKGTAKQNRRCRLIGFWIRDPEMKSGRRGAFWLSEEDGEYRVAKFDFYHD